MDLSLSRVLSQSCKVEGTQMSKLCRYFSDGEDRGLQRLKKRYHVELQGASGARVINEDATGNHPPLFRGPKATLESPSLGGALSRLREVKLLPMSCK